MIEKASLLIAALSAASALIAAIAASRSAGTAKRALESQVAPDIIVYVAPNPNSPSVALLCLRNIGGSPAFDVKVSFDEGLPDSGYPFVPVEETGFVRGGIAFLEPGGERTTFIGYFHDLIDQVGERAIWAKLKYKDKRKRGYENECCLDFSSFDAAVGDTPLAERSLRSIAESLRAMKNNIKKG